MNTRHQENLGVSGLHLGKTSQKQKKKIRNGLKLSVSMLQKWVSNVRLLNPF